MIGFLPQFYEDELFYSLMARYFVRSGYTAVAKVNEDFFTDARVITNIEFTKALNPYAHKMVMQNNSVDDIINNHTMFNAYNHFVPWVKRTAAYDMISRFKANNHNLYSVPITEEKRYLRYCPLCAKADRKQYGETYWHRLHQLQYVNICHKHTCRLIETDIVITKRQGSFLSPAENIVPHVDKLIFEATEREIEFIRYLVEVVRCPIQLEETQPVSVLLDKRLKPEYTGKSGILRYVDKILYDYAEYFKGMPTMNKHKLNGIFLNSIHEEYFICQLAFWEGISAYELTHLPPGSEISYSTKKQNYDTELLPQVKKTVKDFYSQQDRPVRLTFKYALDALGLAKYTLRNLPLCNEYINNHIETNPEYHSRLIEWAVKELTKSDEEITFKNLNRLTGLPRKNMQACRELLSDKAKGILKDVL